MAGFSTFAKWLIREYGETAALAVYTAFFEDDVDLNPRDIPWHRVELHFTRTAPTGYGEDRAIVKLDMISINALFEDSDWETADFTGAETALNAFWGSLQPYVLPSHTLAEYRWSRMGFADPMTQSDRFLDRGSPVRVTTVGTAGSNATASYVPYQTACSITWKTPLRRHWGRSYIPGISGGMLGSTGRYSNAMVDAFATAARTLHVALNTNETPMFIPSTQHAVSGGGSAYAPAMFGVSAIQVDNVPDIIRRRRVKQTSYRKEFTT